MIDWEALEYLGLADEIQRLVGVHCWLYNFEIDELVYCELTLEALSIIKIDNAQANLHYPGGLCFEVHGEQ